MYLPQWGALAEEKKRTKYLLMKNSSSLERLWDYIINY